MDENLIKYGLGAAVAIVGVGLRFVPRRWAHVGGMACIVVGLGLIVLVVAFPSHGQAPAATPAAAAPAPQPTYPPAVHLPVPPPTRTDGKDETGATPTSDYATFRRHWLIVNNLARDYLRQGRGEPNLHDPATRAEFNAKLKAQGEHWVIREADAASLMGMLLEDSHASGPGVGLQVNGSSGLTVGGHSDFCGGKAGIQLNGDRGTHIGGQVKGHTDCPPMPALKP